MDFWEHVMDAGYTMYFIDDLNCIAGCMAPWCNQ